MHQKNGPFISLYILKIIANKETGIDVDKWDYYSRDCHYLGILQDFQWKLVIQKPNACRYIIVT